MGLLTGGGRQHLFVGPLAGTLIWLLLRSVFKLSGAQLFFHGLKAYYTQNPDLATGQQKGDLSTRKGRKQAAKQVQLKGDEEQSVFVSPVGADSVKRGYLYAKDFDDLVLVTVLVACNTAVAVLGAWLLGADANLSMSLISVAALCFGVVLALKVDMGSDKSNGIWDMIHLVIVGVLGTAASGYFLSPFTSDEFGFNAARKAIDQASAVILQNMQQHLGPAAEGVKPREQGPLFALGLCLMAGLMAASLCGPAVRFATGLYFMTQVPSWGTQYLSFSRFTVWKARAGILAPLLVVALQISPCPEEGGLVPPEWRHHLLSAALLLTAVVHMANANAMCQAWLNNGLMSWFTNRHSGLEHPKKAEIMHARLYVTRMLLCRTAVQVFALVSITLSAATLLALHSKGGVVEQLQQPSARAAPIAAWEALRQQPWAASLVNGLECAAAAYSAPPTPSTPSAPHIAAATVDGLEGLNEAPTPSTPSTPSAQSVGNLDLGPLFVFLGQFYGWWACLVWSVVACGTLAVHRLGLSS